VDKTGQTIDFLLTEHRDEQAATCFLTQAIRCHGVPKTITIAGSEASAAAIRRYNAQHGTAIIIRQVKYRFCRRSCARMTRTKSTLNVTVGTTKKSMAATSLTWLFKNVFHVGEGGCRGRNR
jgi:transposase-like protein